MIATRSPARSDPYPIPASGEPLNVGPLELDLDQRLLRVDDIVVPIASRTFEVLVLLAMANGRPVDRAELFRKIWGRPMRRRDRSVDVQIVKLRRSLARACPDWTPIQTHRREGYSLTPTPTQPRQAPKHRPAQTTRRSTPSADPPYESHVDAGPLRLVPDYQLVTIDGKSCRLRPQDARLLARLTAAPGRVIAREQLAAAIGRPTLPGDRTIDVAVHRIRTQLRRAAPRWELIHTHRARGYRYEPTQPNY